MSYNKKIIRSEEYKISKWSGGTTTQIYIYPEESTYNDLNFKWRLSSANVNLEESTFTHLPGISRKIMTLDNELILEHENRYTRNLKPFEVESFSGDWKTKSYGKVTDFNLMINKDCDGDLKSLTINKNSSVEIYLENKDNKYKYISKAFYCVDGNFKIVIDNEELNVNKYDLLLVTMEKEDTKLLKIINESHNNIKVIQSVIVF
ncbi:HutD/Ves family protein [Romboutsia maritimum]|uniref:HutD/Ves family protein n=1 Tax=Romboutsia maritimum TaxID=2020948 RepID=UPI0013145F33|nr:HutD family protein [Romboutsia maritimum]